MFNEEKVLKQVEEILSKEKVSEVKEVLDVINKVLYPLKSDLVIKDYHFQVFSEKDKSNEHQLAVHIKPGEAEDWIVWDLALQTI